MMPTQQPPAPNSRLGALELNVSRRRQELEVRVMRLMQLSKLGEFNQQGYDEFYLLKRKIEELVGSNKDLKKQLEYKGKGIFGKYKSGVIEATKCLANSEEDVKRFNNALDDILDPRYQY